MVVDRIEDIDSFTSDLGIELLKMKDSNSDSLDPMLFKDILTTTEDLRIATQLSDLASKTSDDSIHQEERKILNRRFELAEGQQCCRDFFLCLEANLVNWPDICSNLQFGLFHSTVCLSCNHSNSSETVQMFLELQIPQDCCKLNDLVEENLNQSELVAMECEENCRKTVQKEKRVQLRCGLEAKFFIVVLSRGVHGNVINTKKIVATEEVFVR